METPLANHLAALYDVPVVQPINSYLYSYEKDGQAHIVKVGQDPTFEQRTIEVQWVNYLAERGIGMARAIPSVNGELVEKIMLDREEYCAVSMEKIPGAPPTTQEWSPHLFKRLGGVIGRMHLLTQQFHRDFPHLQRQHWHEGDIYNTAFIPAKLERVRKVCDELIAEVRALPRDADTYGLIHGDIHQWNFHLWQDAITFFDTDECECHYFAHDLGVLINSAVEESFNGTAINSYAETFIGHLLEGYAECRPLSKAWIERLPLFIRLREMMSFLDAFLMWDMDNLELHQRIALNRYQNTLENGVPLVQLDFRQFA